MAPCGGQVKFALMLVLSPDKLARVFKRALYLLAAFSAAGTLQAQSIPAEFIAVEFVSAHPDGNVLKGYLSRAIDEIKPGLTEPLVVALHGCGGLWDARGELGLRYREYRAWLKTRGISLLLVDSFGTRGKARGICTEPLAHRSIRPVDRRLDVQGALQWLQGQAWVDRQRVFLLGWSHGASTVLSTLNRDNAQAIATEGTPNIAGGTATSASHPVPTTRPRELMDFKAAIAFYPGCGPASQNPDYQLTTALLLMIGEDDNWTPARDCERFYRQQTEKLQQRGLESGLFQLKLYPGAHHGFDSSLPVRHRRDVPNGVNRGRGVTAGGHPASREDAFKTLDVFLKQYL